MKNGYYVSAYCCIDEEGCCLNAQIRHDQSIALWEVYNSSVSLVRYWELERYTRKKQHMQPFINRTHFLEVLNDLLEEVSISTKDIIEIWGIPDLAQSKMDVLFGKRYNLPLHSLFHIFSSLIDTKKLFKEAHLVLALDGGPDNLIDNGFDLPNHYCAAFFKNGEIVSIESISSPAYIWAEASDKFRMREGTLMALAEACNCSCDDVSLDIPIFNGMWEIPTLREEFERKWELIKNRNLDFDERFSEDENRISCFMKIIQKTSCTMVENEINKLMKKYDIIPQSTIVSLVGGFALNCPTNTWIMKHFKFKEFVSPPCVNDSGMALGIGLLNFYLHLKKGLEFDLQHAFWGHEENAESYEFIIKKYNHFIEDINDFSIHQFVQDLEAEPICWFEGKCEIGPRALGHRSILSSASSIMMKDKLNQIKQRQWWRPVAPMVLDIATGAWFEDNISSPYMLHAVKIKPEKANHVPAILHLNNTARIQTLTSKDALYSIVMDYYKITGIPMICNTSLNDKSEPIINTYEELLNFALRKAIRVIYIDKKRIKLYNHSDYTEHLPHKSNNKFDSYLQNQSIKFTRYTDIDIDDEDLDFYVNHRHYFEYSIIGLPKCQQKEIVYNVRKKVYENLSS